jgi:hypothetical protein
MLERSSLMFELPRAFSMLAILAILAILAM